MSAINVPFTVAIDARLVSTDATGDSTYWTGLLYGLAQTQPNIDFLLFSNKPQPPGIPTSPRFRWVSLPGSSRWWSLVRFPLLARRMGARVLHTQYNLSPLAGKRGVTTVHDVSFFIEPSWFPTRDRLLLQRFVPASARRAAAVVTVSETSKAEIARYIPDVAAKVVAIHNACGISRRRMEPDEAVMLADIEGPYVFTVGTRWPRKNMQLAIDACEALPADLPHRLVVTGKPGWGDERPGGRTLFTGYVGEDRLSALFSAASLYLAPSRHEGFGIPVLEAFRCGAPVVSSSGGALPEVVGGAGEVLDSWEPSAWTARIEDLLRDSGKLERMRQAGFARERLFTWAASAERHAAVYEGVAQ